MCSTITFVALFQLVLVQTQCPPGFFQGLNEKCFIEFPGNYTFCGANKRCADLGQEINASIFMLGKSFDDLYWPLLKEPYYMNYWTSINGLLIKPKSCYDKWRVAHPSAQIFAYENCSLRWGEMYEGEIPNRLAVFIGGRLYSIGQRGKDARVVCELGDPKPPDRLTRFHSRFPENITDYFFNDELHEGCFVETSVSSLMECGLKCKLNDQCKSFYYNREEKRCYQSMYVDSLLPEAYRIKPNTWERFALMPSP